MTVVLSRNVCLLSDAEADTRNYHNHAWHSTLDTPYELSKYNCSRNCNKHSINNIILDKYETRTFVVFSIQQNNNENDKFTINWGNLNQSLRHCLFGVQRHDNTERSIETRPTCNNEECAIIWERRMLNILNSKLIPSDLLLVIFKTDH